MVFNINLFRWIYRRQLHIITMTVDFGRADRRERWDPELLNMPFPTLCNLTVKNLPPNRVSHIIHLYPQNILHKRLERRDSG